MILECPTRGDTKFMKFWVLGRETVKAAKKRICDTRVLNSRKYERFEILGLTAAIGCEAVKAAKKTICDTWVLNMRRYEDFEILGLKAAIG